jgi:predicted acyltransferase
MVVTAMLGNFAGEILRSARLTMERKVLSLAIFALLLSGVGLLVAEGFGEYSLPVNKPLWTSSYTLVVGGIASLLPPVWGAFVTQAGMIALGWSALYWLYRRNIFLRV